MQIGGVEKPVVYFDGVCNLCDRSVKFIIRNDKKQQFLFAPVQSVAGSIVLNNLGYETKNEPNSVILEYKGKYYFRSGGALNILRLLGSIWSLAYVFIIVPAFIRDIVYNIISKNRYNWFGKSEACMIPTPALKARFLD